MSIRTYRQSSHSRINRLAIDTSEGRRRPISFRRAKSSLWNHRASSSSTSSTRSSPPVPHRMKPEHQGRWEWPGLRRLVADLAHFYAGLLTDLSNHRFRQALSRLDETGQGRIDPLRPNLLSPEKTAITILHKHDDGGIGPRKMLLLTTLVSASPYVPRLLGRRGMAAPGRSSGDARSTL